MNAIEIMGYVFPGATGGFTRNKVAGELYGVAVVDIAYVEALQLELQEAVATSALYQRLMWELKDSLDSVESRS